jgi:hypothetical protein
MTRGPENEDEQAAVDAGRAPLGFIGYIDHLPPRQAERAAARQEAVTRVAEFLAKNYPCDCEEDCGFPDLNEAAAIVEMVEAQFFPNEQRCRHCQDPIYLFEWRWRHTNGMYTCTMPRPEGQPRRPRAEP